MENLFTYAGAILQKKASPPISGRSVETSSWQDQGFEVCKEATTYRFDNGVVIRRTVERDSFPSAAACAECWISYEVLSDGSLDNPVSPRRKTFENACRESFWLSYHMA